MNCFTSTPEQRTAWKHVGSHGFIIWNMDNYFVKGSTNDAWDPLPVWAAYFHVECLAFHFVDHVNTLECLHSPEGSTAVQQHEQCCSSRVSRSRLFLLYRLRFTAEKTVKIIFHHSFNVYTSKYLHFLYPFQSKSTSAFPVDWIQ